MHFFNNKIKYISLFFLTLFFAVISFQLPTNGNFEKIIDFNKADAKIINGCDCPNGEKKASGNWDFGAAWQYCDNCKEVTNREASSELCNC